MALFRERRGTPADLLVVGLGNPGPEYELTRHNIGAQTVALLASRYSSSLKLGKEQATVAELRIGTKQLVVAFPQTFMNDSGVSVRALINRYGIEDLSRLLVIHDELDFETGRVQVKFGGGLAGHNGLKSIVQHVKSEDFGRVRIGIGRPQGNGSDYVLKRPGKADATELAIASERAADAAEALLSATTDEETLDYRQVMNQFNVSS